MIKGHLPFWLPIPESIPSDVDELGYDRCELLDLCINEDDVDDLFVVLLCCCCPAELKFETPFGELHRPPDDNRKLFTLWFVPYNPLLARLVNSTRSCSRTPASSRYHAATSCRLPPAVGSGAPIHHFYFIERTIFKSIIHIFII